MAISSSIADACPNLLRAASHYRYSDDPIDRRSETPVDAHNHALAALRYMVTKIDEHQLARAAKKVADETGIDEAEKQRRRQKKWLSYRNEALWRRIF